MAKFRFNKLVRDKIASNIESKKGKVELRKLSKKNFWKN